MLDFNDLRKYQSEAQEKIKASSINEFHTENLEAVKTFITNTLNSETFDNTLKTAIQNKIDVDPFADSFNVSFELNFLVDLEQTGSCSICDSKLKGIDIYYFNYKGKSEDLVNYYVNKEKNFLSDSCKYLYSTKLKDYLDAFTNAIEEKIKSYGILIYDVMKIQASWTSEYGVKFRITIPLFIQLKEKND